MKLSPAQVIAIRNLALAGQSHTSIAAQFGVARPTISVILSRREAEICVMLTVEEFRRKYPGSSEEQVALYGATVAAELARGPVAPEPDLPMPMITVQRAPSGRRAASGKDFPVTDDAPLWGRHS